MPTVPEVGEKFQSVSVRLRKVLALGSNSSGLGITYSTEAVDEIHQTLQVCNEQLVKSFLTGEALSTVEHRACVQIGRSDGREIKKEKKEAHIAREKRSKTSSGRMRLERTTVASAWITVVPDLLNGDTLSAKGF